MRTSFNQDPTGRNSWRAKTISALSAASLALTLSACTGNSSAESPTANTTTNSTAENRPTTLVPDMQGFLKPGATDTCFNGGPRPCALLLRTKPQLAGQIINAEPSNPMVVWPLESYDNKAGDKVIVLCHTTGQTIHPYEGDGSSDQWYEVAVPPEHIYNPTVLQEVTSKDPSVTVIQQGGQFALRGYASIEWFHQDTPAPGVPACAS